MKQKEKKIEWAKQCSKCEEKQKPLTLSEASAWSECIFFSYTRQSCNIQTALSSQWARKMSKKWYHKFLINRCAYVKKSFWKFFFTQYIFGRKKWNRKYEKSHHICTLYEPTNYSKKNWQPSQCEIVEQHTLVFSNMISASCFLIN